MRIPRPFFVLSLFLALLRSSAATGLPDPLPTPTNAAEGRTSTLTAGCVVSSSAGLTRDAAREAAWLTALYRLAVQVRPPAPDAWFRIDPAHPEHDLLGWLVSSRPTEETSAGGVLRMTLESPPLETLGSPPPMPAPAWEADVDGDGRSEQIRLAADSRIHIHRGERVVTVSTGLGELAARALPGPRGLCEMVRLSRPIAILGAAPAGPGQVRLRVRFRRSEALGLRWAESADEDREVLLGLIPPGKAPTIEISEPDPGTPLTQSRTPLRGRVRAPEGLSEVRLSLNGRELWRSPQGLNGQALGLDLVLDLRPGENHAILKATDRSGSEVERRLDLRSLVPGPEGQGAALVVGPPPPGAGAEEAGRALHQAGLEVRQMAPSQVTPGVLDALARAGRSGAPVVLYLTGHFDPLAAPGAEVNFGGAPGLDLAEVLQRLNGCRVLMVLDLESDDCDRRTSWLAGSRLLDRLAAPGRLLLLSGRAAQDRPGLMPRALSEAWQAGGDPLAATLRAYPTALEACATGGEALKNPQALPFSFLRQD